jgi:hypothetical protein
MLDDLLKERLTDYANAGSEATRALSLAQIRRRGHRHYARLAAGTLVVAVLAAGGIAVGVGRLDRSASVPPAATQPRPATTTTLGNGETATTVGLGSTKPPAVMPATFVAAVESSGRSRTMRLAVVSRTTGKVIRYLEPTGHQDRPRDLVVSADRSTAWFAYGGCAQQTGVFRVALSGGAITKVLSQGANNLALSSDGSKLAYVVAGCGTPQGSDGDVVVRDLASGAERHWQTHDVQLSDQQPLAFSPSGRQLAVVVGRVDQQQQLRLVDTTRAGRLADAPIVGVPDRGCWFTNVAYQPHSGRLAVVEECYPAGEGPGQNRPQLLFLDSSGGQLLAARSLVLSVEGLPDIFSMSFDPSGSRLLYWAGQVVGGDSEPDPLTFVVDGDRVTQVPGRFHVPAW